MMEENRMVLELENSDSPEEIAAAFRQREQFDRNSAWLQAHILEIGEFFRGKIICIAGKELFVGDTTREAVAKATAAHPDDKGWFTQYIYKEKATRIYVAKSVPATLTPRRVSQSSDPRGFIIAFRVLIVVFLTISLVPRRVLAQPATPKSEYDAAVKELKRLNAKLETDDKSADKRVVAVSFLASKVTDDDLKILRGLTGLKSLDLGFTRISDKGMKYLGDLASLETLSLAGAQYVGDDGLAAIKGLTNLKVIDFAGTRVTDKGMASLVGMRDLKSLRVSGNISDRGLKSLQGLKNLKELHLEYSQVSGSGLQYIGNPQNVVSVSLCACIKVTDDDLKILARLTNLRSLDVGFTQISDKGMMHLTDLASLETLKLTADENVGNDGLAATEWLTKLKVIDFAGTRVTDEGMASLAEMRDLESIEVSSNISDKGLQAIKGLQRLSELRLNYSQVDGSGLKFVAAPGRIRVLGLRQAPLTNENASNIEAFENLTDLMLGATRIGDQGLKHLRGLRKLQHLELYGSSITDSSLEVLAGLKELQWLSLGSCKPLTKEGVAKLQKKLPKCKILAPEPVVGEDDPARRAVR
jgi:Leucine-rich repeat (LRR) protein